MPSHHFAPPQARRTEATRPMLIRNGRIVDPANGRDEVADLLVIDGRIAGTDTDIGAGGLPDGTETVDASGHVVAPGLVDMRVFIGEPGYEHRETLASASRAAAAGGVTTIACMPDTDPVIDDPALVDFVLRAASDTAIVHVQPLAALTRGLDGAEMTEIGLLREAGAAAFASGRRGIANPRVMRRLLTYAGDFDAVVINHVEDDDLVGDGVMNEGETATRLGLLGIPSVAETVMLDRDLRLVALSGGRYHAAMLSTADGVAAMRRAKADGLDVSCGVAATHLALNENDIGPYRTFFRLSPPLRSEDDRQALIAGVADGTIDAIVSNHDPQDVETKRHPFSDAADGAIGLETLLPASLRLVHNDEVSLTRVIEALSAAPARRLGIDTGTLSEGTVADVIVFDPDLPWIVDLDDLQSRSKNSPFETARMQGKVVRTLIAGRTVYEYVGA